MNKQKIFLISVLAILAAGIFYFFYVPKPTCTMLRDPSGKPSEVCDLGGRQSPYQKIFLKMHMYFYPNDTCMISIETGDVDCEPSISLFSPICDQSTTTTPCSVLENMRSHPPEQPVATSTPVSEWETFENKELGISFTYPVDKNSDDVHWGISHGTTGRMFHAAVNLPSGAVIYAYATTKDYSAEKDGFGVGTEGFVVENKKYHVVSRGNSVSTIFVPDEVWGLSDSSNVPVLYGKKYYPSVDYTDAAAKAMVNLPNTIFTGIGFVLWKINDTGSHSVVAADLVIFKKIVTSIQFIEF